MSMYEYQTSTFNKEEYCDIELEKLFGCSLPEVRSLSDLIRELNIIFSSDNVNVDLVKYVMDSYKSNPPDWKKFAKFDRCSYTRNLVDDGNGKYNLMLLCWGEGHASGIHDHANSHCFMKMLQGSLEEIRYAWPKGKSELKEIGRTRLDLNGLSYINGMEIADIDMTKRATKNYLIPPIYIDSLGLHRVANVSSYDTAISLHLYCPPYNQCTVFDRKNGNRTSTSVTFHSIFGKRNKGQDHQYQTIPNSMTNEERI